MKRIVIMTLLIAALSITSLLTLSDASYAVSVAPNDCRGEIARTDLCKEILAQQGASGSNPIVTAIRTAINILSIIVGVAAIVGVIISGLRLVLANGDSNAVSQARAALTYSLIGVAVAAFAQVIVAFVLSRF